MSRTVPFFEQYENKDESHVTHDDLARIVALPVEESMRVYIGLRNFNDEYPAYMNVICTSPQKSTVFSGEGLGWMPEFTERCANVVLDCYVTRLVDFAKVKPTSEWNANVAKMIDLPTGMTKWDHSKRKKYTRKVVVIMRFLTDYEKHKIGKPDPKYVLEHFLEFRVECSPDAVCPYMDFVQAFKAYAKDYFNSGSICMDKALLTGPFRRLGIRVQDMIHEGIAGRFVVGLRLRTQEIPKDGYF